MMTSQPPSPTSQLKSTFEDLEISSRKSRKHHQYETEEAENNPEFHYFILLPAELRLKIYILSLPAPRIIPIHYLSSTSTASLSRTPSPSPSPYQPTHKRICRPSTITSNTKSKSEYAGCTSPATIPALLHTCRESRALAKEYYTLSFRLTGPIDLFMGKIWFSTPPASTSTSISHPNKHHTSKHREQDILYFPSLPGYCASFKHYNTILSLLPSSTLASITHLAVHEDLFLEENKRRASLDSGLGWDGSDWGLNGGDGGSRGGMGYWNTNDVIEERLFDFWRSVSRRFTGVKEVRIVGDGRENDVLISQTNACCSDESLGLIWDWQDRSGFVGNGSEMGKERESFAEMVGRVVGCVEDEMGGMWTVPRWWVLRSGCKYVLS